jgi:hypothetical protein
MTLYRGKFAGVFCGANGYYVAQMAADGVTHYQPCSGNGWIRANIEHSKECARKDRTARWCPYCCHDGRDGSSCDCGFLAGSQ